MSFAPESLLDAGVLRHSAPRPAALTPPDPSEEELAFNWTLSERDIDFIMTNHRGSENLCRLAIQLCVLRQHGRFLATYTHVSPAILGYLCRQLDLSPISVMSSPMRANTESDYQRETALYLGWRSFDAAAQSELREWVVDQVAEQLYVEDLAEKASAWLRTRRIVLPGPVVFERTVNAAYAQAEYRIFERLAQPLSQAAKQAIDALLGAGPEPAGLPGEVDPATHVAGEEAGPATFFASPNTRQNPRPSIS